MFFWLLYSVYGFFQQVPNTPLGRVEQLMAFHRFWDAYQELNQIIQNDGKKAEMKLYRLRSHCALSMSMSNEAINDASVVLNNKNADNQEKQLCSNIRARAYMQLGKFNEAQVDANNSGDRQLIRTAQECGKMALSYESYLKSGQVGEAVQLLDQLIKIAPHAQQFAFERAQIAWNMNDYGRFSELSKNLASSYPEDSTLMYRMGIVSFCNGNIEEASKHINSAIKLKKPPKNCSVALSSISDVNKFYPEANRLLKMNNHIEAKNAIEKVHNAGLLFCSENSVLIQAAYLIKAQIIRSMGNKNETLDFLNNMTSKYPDNNDFLIERGELNLELGDYDAALFDFSTAQRRNPNDSRIQNGINKAQQMKKQATTVDYYKILDVPRDTSMNDIKLAYKKKVREWHPDRFGDKEKKKEAESMMKQINIAYDVLGNPQKKQLYDAGRDPEDPMGDQNMHGFNPFDMFFNRGGGGGGGEYFQFGGGQGFRFEFRF